MSRIIYIAGLGHSGTTLLDISLGTVNEITGLGEVRTLMDDQSLDRHFSSYCSCGARANECVFWSGIPEILKNLDTAKDKYEAILEHLDQRVNKNQVAVDSSKNSESYLEYLDKNHDLKVLFITRDIRSWCYTRHLSTGKPVAYFILRWFLENLKLIRRIKSMGIEPIFIGYEEIALFPGKMLKYISGKTGIEYSENMLNPVVSNSHIISGNIARVDPEKRSGWYYDARWFLSARMMFWSPLLLFFRKMNKRLVYSNIGGSSMKSFYMFGTARKREMDREFN